MAERLPTGIDVLDRELDGGFPAGSVVAYQDPPASQGELLLYELSIPRPTYYLTADRTESAVADAFESSAVPANAPELTFLPEGAPLDTGRRAFRNVPEGSTLIIDPADALERTERSRYQTFLSELQNHMRNTNSVAILHCLKSDHSPELRDTTEHMADVVIDLRQTVTASDVETRISIPKLRGGRALSETIKLNLGDRVRIDTSRDIA
ncbi:RAD55 family ATPase [Halocalculus aciditolerans]|uniref:Recombinase RecA n=1 Tax=Halocalculus aciditolerans TaxID=1383812 RepID=A0A830F1W9_9EURY|nr:transcriptional regulator [Halocalculus aciditolerans]GGL53895.1 recombinase RecA [Halocalculus aciditolerans]